MDSACSSAYDFNAKLHNISNNLGEQEVRLLVFLCKDYIPDPSTINDCRDVFKKLQERRLIETNNAFFLQELLYYIDRYDLLHNYLDTEEGQVKEKINDPGRTHISPFRRLLLDLLQSNLDDKMEEIKEFLKKYINESQLGKVTNMLEVFLLMENSGVLREDNVGSLKAVLDGIGCQELLLRVEKFEKQYQESNIENVSGKELETPKKEIKKVFKSRGYTTEKRDDLTAERMLDIMKQFADMNHENYDSFVCFILSHGGFGVIYGTDGNKMPISKLIRCFDNQHCKSLIGKPKIFFVQACRGEVLQRPVYEADASASEYECDSLPYHSDFLTAYATVEDYKAFRHKINGSIYIQELCAALKDPKLYCTELQTILTMVQNNISKPEHRLEEFVDGKPRQVLAKQMPSFQSELCKTLNLPAPSQITANTLDRTEDLTRSSCNCV